MGQDSLPQVEVHSHWRCRAPAASVPVCLCFGLAVLAQHSLQADLIYTSGMHALASSSLCHQPWCQRGFVSPDPDSGQLAQLMRFHLHGLH